MVFKSRAAKEEKKPDSQNMAMTFISKGTEIKGDIHAAGNLRVDGYVIGNVHSEGDVEISSGGAVEGAQVCARNIIIHGRVKATLVAIEQLRIHAGGEVNGDVTAKQLDIEAGASFVGYSDTGVSKSDTSFNNRVKELASQGK